MTNVIIYHSPCFDGMGAAYAAWKHFGDEDTIYMPANYGQPVVKPPKDSNIFMLDFSYPKDVIKRLADDAKNIMILDHHKTAEADLEEFKEMSTYFPHVRAIFDMERSGAMIAWQYFHPNEPIPKLISYVQDRDLWQFKLPQTHEVHAGLSIHPFNVKAWDELMYQDGNVSGLTGHTERIPKDPTQQLANSGRSVLRAKEVHVDKMMNEKMKVTLGGYTFPVVNASDLFSEAAVACIDPDLNIGGYFYIREGGVVHFGLRSKGDFDVSAICKQYGGGGHRNAAGFTTTIAHLAEIIQVVKNV